MWARGQCSIRDFYNMPWQHDFSDGTLAVHQEWRFLKKFTLWSSQSFKASKCKVSWFYAFKFFERLKEDSTWCRIESNPFLTAFVTVVSLHRNQKLLQMSNNRTLQPCFHFYSCITDLFLLLLQLAKFYHNRSFTSTPWTHHRDEKGSGYVEGASKQASPSLEVISAYQINSSLTPAHSYINTITITFIVILTKYEGKDASNVYWASWYAFIPAVYGHMLSQHAFCWRGSKYFLLRIRDPNSHVLIVCLEKQ